MSRFIRKAPSMGRFAPPTGQSWEIALLEIGVGNQQAALELDRALNHFSPQAALFVGVAGGIKRKARGCRCCRENLRI